MPKIWHYINKPVCTKTRTDLIKKDRPDDSQRSDKAKKTEQRRRLLLLNVPSSQSSGRRRSDCKSQNHRRSFKWETSRSIWRQIRRRLTKRRPKRRNRKRRINREPTTKISRSQLCVCLHSARRSTTADVQQHASKSIEILVRERKIQIRPNRILPATVCNNSSDFLLFQYQQPNTAVPHEMQNYFNTGINSRSTPGPVGPSGQLPFLQQSNPLNVFISLGFQDPIGFSRNNTVRLTSGPAGPPFFMSRVRSE